MQQLELQLTAGFQRPLSSHEPGRADCSKRRGGSEKIKCHAK